MKTTVHLIQYTIRGVPPEVDRMLRQKAEHRKLSLNRVVLDELIAATVATDRKPTSPTF